MFLRRRTLISLFVIVWSLVFHYETLRLNYLSPLAGRQLPKVPLLFPPAGWIMFYNVDRSYGFAEVYGRLGETLLPVDPHAIFPMKNVGYDNIRRNVLVGVLDVSHGQAFCNYLHRKFPMFQGFIVGYAQYPDLIADPDRLERRAMYRCQ